MDEIEFLPLTEVAFEVLISLSRGTRHGYAIMTEVAERTDGRLKLHAGSLYRALGRMLDSGLIDEVEDDGSDSSERRRSYRITPLGRRVAKLESARLSRQLSAARSARLISKEEVV